MTPEQLARVLYNALSQTEPGGGYMGLFQLDAFYPTNTTCLDGDYDLVEVAKAVLEALDAAADPCGTDQTP